MSIRPAVWLLGLTTFFGAGCQSALVYHNAHDGAQWVWPHFADGHPTVLAFWSTDEIQCLEDVPGLNTLAGLDSPVQLVSIGTGPDRQRIDDWIRGYYRHSMNYVALVDQEERLARRFWVSSYPTYIFLDMNRNEVDRVHDLRLVHRWFTRPHWLEQGTGGPKFDP